MIGNLIPLDIITVPVPCPVNWDDMSVHFLDAAEGCDRVRYCGQCKHRVYNLSEMSREEAERLIEAKEGRLCVRFYRRPDGTVLTRDCQKEAGRFRRLLATAVGLAAAAILLLIAGYTAIAGANGKTEKQARLGPREVEPFRTILNWLWPAPPPPPPAPSGNWTTGMPID
jgi:hypothetical protein